MAWFHRRPRSSKPVDLDEIDSTAPLDHPDPLRYRSWRSFDRLVPAADWFWESLQRYCDPGCCGLAACDFSAESVAWACGWGTSPPPGDNWRVDTPGDPAELARELRAAARQIRLLGPGLVSSERFGDVLTAESYAQLFEDLADKTSPTH